MSKLIPGANAALTAENPGLANVMVGLGWSVIASRGPQAELVPLAIMCDASGRALSDDHLVFFNQIASPEGAVHFVGDEDNEQIDVDFSLVPAAVAKIVFLVYVDPEVRGPGNFSSVGGAHIRITDRQNLELVRFDAPVGHLSNINAMMLGELYRHSGGWKFRALGQGFTTGLRGVADDFGIAI